MNRNVLANNIKRKRHNLKQIKEALKLVEDLDWKISWALDFSEHSDINDSLEPIQNALSTAQEELEEQQEQIEYQIQEYKEQVDRMKAEIAEEVFL